MNVRCECSAVLPRSPKRVAVLGGCVFQGEWRVEDLRGQWRVSLEMAHELGLGFSVDFVEGHKLEGLL